jgi:hypothetical protein
VHLLVHHAILNLVYKFREGGANMRKHEGVVKGHTVCMIANCAFIWFLYMKTSLQVKVMEQHMTNNHLAHHIVNKVYINE